MLWQFIPSLGEVAWEKKHQILIIFKLICPLFNRETTRTRLIIYCWNQREILHKMASKNWKKIIFVKTICQNSAQKTLVNIILTFYFDMSKRCTDFKWTPILSDKIQNSPIFIGSIFTHFIGTKFVIHPFLLGQNSKFTPIYLVNIFYTQPASLTNLSNLH